MSQWRERRCLNVLWWRRLRVCLNQSLPCPHRPMLGRAPARWSAKQHQKKNKTPPSVLTLHFFPRPLFPFHAESRTLCSLSFFHRFFFLSFVARRLLSASQPASLCGQLFNMSSTPLDLMSEEILSFTSAFK